MLLVLNVGSSSLKAAVVESDGSGVQRHWQAETPRQPNLNAQLSSWLAPALSPWWPNLHAAAHRVVHGGERFTAPTRIEGTLLEELEQLSSLAPLHNPPALAAMRWLQRQQPQLPQWACFDTAFHASLPPEAYTYALPAAWRKGGHRRYGFHGLNHQHVAEATPGCRLISAHLGAGCSLAAIRDGCSIDTTMGFTPLEGLVMASRSGSVDPGLMLHLLRQGVSLAELDRGLHGSSGLLGLSGLSADWRALRVAAADGHAGAQLAQHVFLHALRRGIGAMAASLGGVDQVVLSGGIGAHDAQLLEELSSTMRWMGCIHWGQLPADEEGMIAKLVARRISGQADLGSGGGGGSDGGGRR